MPPIAQNPPWNGMFISHAHEDKRLVRALEVMIDDLFAGYFHIFATAIKPIEGGQLWRDEIRTNLAKARVMLVLITERSIQRPWIPFEAGAAWLDSVEKKKILIPCLFDYPEFPTILSNYEGVRLLERDDIKNKLIPGLSSSTGLNPSPRYIDDIVNDFLEVALELKKSLDAHVKKEPEPFFDHDRFFRLTIDFFDRDTHQAKRYIDMLRRQGVLIDEDSYQHFLMQLKP